MGYYASGSGTLYLKRNDQHKWHELAKKLNSESDDIKTVLSTLSNKAWSHYSLEVNPWDDHSNEDFVCLDVCHEYDKYHEDDIMEFLTLLKPLLAYVSNTGIFFVGQDGEQWKFEVSKDCEYIEINGEVVYDGQTCDKVECAFQYKGYCQCHKVHGRYPTWTDNKCSEYLLDNRKGNQNVM